jgi:hypothetical protein
MVPKKIQGWDFSKVPIGAVSDQCRRNARRKLTAMN